MTTRKMGGGTSRGPHLFGQRFIVFMNMHDHQKDGGTSGGPHLFGQRFIVFMSIRHGYRSYGKFRFVFSVKIEIYSWEREYLLSLLTAKSVSPECPRAVL